MTDVLSSITANIKGLFKGLGKSSTSVLGIDVGSSAIKIVQLKKEGGKIVLQTYGEVATGPYGDMQAGEMPTLSIDKLSGAIKDVIKASNVTTQNVAMSIQSSGSLLFVLRLPKMSQSELAKTVPNEARKYIPVAPSDVSLDWWPIPEQEYIDNPEAEGNKTQEVLVVAIRKETIGKYNDIVKKVGLTSALLEVEVFSAIRSSFRHELQPVVIVDFGASSTRVAIVEYGVVKTFHTINRGSHYLSQALASSLEISFEKAEEIKKEGGMVGISNAEAGDIVKTTVNYIFSEIKNVILDYEKDYNRSIGKMMLVGGGSRLNGLHEHASREFSFEIEYGDPFSKAESPEFLKEVLRDSGPEFSIAVGLALQSLQ